MVLLTLSMTILLFYTSLVRVTNTIDMEIPTFEQYLELYSTYSETLTCACTEVSIDYDKLLRVHYTMHQVCNSTFVTQEWIDYLATPTEAVIFNEDFQVTAPAAFQALHVFCSLTNSTISNSLIRFYSSQYISAFVISSKLFETQTQSLTDQFRSAATNSFLLSLSAIRDTTKGNGLVSGLQTNYGIQLRYGTDSVATAAQTYNNCSCASSSTCITQSSIYKYASEIRLFDVTDFYTGCYVIESLLRSTLRCFYNQSCINKLRSYLPSSLPMTVRALEPSIPSEYLQNSTIKELVDHLMIEEWNFSSTYDGYYNVCRPAQCTYTLETRNDIIYILTTLFGIAGGLITVLKLIVPRLVKLIRKKKEPSPLLTGKRKLK